MAEGLAPKLNRRGSSKGTLVAENNLISNFKVVMELSYAEKKQKI